MRTILISSLCFAAACGAARPQAQTPTQAQRTPAASSTAATPAATAPATGAMRDVLLSLRRVHFPLDSVTLPEASREALAAAAEGLRAHPDVSLSVEGHADERGTDEYNLALSDRRARVVVDYLVRMGVAESRLRILPRGEHAPLLQGTDPFALAKNRRVEFRAEAGGVELRLEDGVPVDDAGRPLDRTQVGFQR